MIGLIVGGLAIFLVSSLWGAVMFRKSRAEIPTQLLEDDEQKIITLIQNGKGKLKQQDVPQLTGYSRPKVTRTIKDLIKKGKVTREKRGKTYILKLN